MDTLEIKREDNKWSKRLSHYRLMYSPPTRQGDLNADFEEEQLKG